MGIKLSHILGNHHGVDDYLVEMTPIIFIVKLVCKFFFFFLFGSFKNGLYAFCIKICCNFSIFYMENVMATNLTAKVL